MHFLRQGYLLAENVVKIIEEMSEDQTLMEVENPTEEQIYENENIDMALVRITLSIIPLKSSKTHFVNQT